MAYTYDESILSDLHKDARGFRPCEMFWSNWHACGDDQRQVIWDGLIKELDAEMERERQEHACAIAEFEQSLAKIQGVLRCDRETAIRAWVESLDGTEDAKFYGASYICFEAGLPYSMAQVFVDAGAATHVG